MTDLSNVSVGNVVSRMAHDARDYFAGGGLRDIAHGIKDVAHGMLEGSLVAGHAVAEFGVGFVKTVACSNVVPYVLPTARQLDDYDFERFIGLDRYGERGYKDFFRGTGASLGICGAVAAGIGQLYFYGDAALHGHPEYLAVPVATNVASGVYEWYRSARQRVAEERNAGSLDERVGSN